MHTKDEAVQERGWGRGGGVAERGWVEEEGDGYEMAGRGGRRAIGKGNGYVVAAGEGGGTVNKADR